MRAMRLSVCLLLLLLAGHAAAASYTPASQKRRTQRFQIPDGCRADDYCPEHLGTFYFTALESALPPKSPELFMMEATEPAISRVYATADANGEHVSYWQLRTVTIQSEPPGLSTGVTGNRGPRVEAPRHILVPFIIDTIVPHVFVGQKAYKYFLDNGALEGEQHLAACNLMVPLPHADVRCIRVFGPTKMRPTNDVRMNALGGLAAATVLAVQEVFDRETSVPLGGLLVPCLSAPNTTQCAAAIEKVADAFISSNAGLQRRLTNVVPKDDASYEAIEVTKGAVREERRMAMKLGITAEIRMHLRAPQTFEFNAAEFIRRVFPKSHVEPAEAPKYTRRSARESDEVPEEETADVDEQDDDEASDAPPPQAATGNAHTTVAATNEEPEDDGEF